MHLCGGRSHTTTPERREDLGGTDHITELCLSSASCQASHTKLVKVSKIVSGNMLTYIYIEAKGRSTLGSSTEYIVLIIKVIIYR